MSPYIYDCGTPAKETHRHLGKDLRGWEHKNIGPLGTNTCCCRFASNPALLLHETARIFTTVWRIFTEKESKTLSFWEFTRVVADCFRTQLYNVSNLSPRGTDYETTNIVKKKKKAVWRKRVRHDKSLKTSDLEMINDRPKSVFLKSLNILHKLCSFVNL